MRTDKRLKQVNKEKNVDRRIQKTKTSLKGALVNIMKEKNIEEITVKELVEEAGINRSTFYLHYMDIYHMLYQMEQELLTIIVDILEGEEEVPLYVNSLIRMEQVCDVFMDNRQMILLLLEDVNDKRFLNELKHILERVIKKIVEERNLHKKIYDNYAYSFCVAGCIGLLTDWLKEERPKSSVYIAKIIDGMFRNSIFSV